MDKIFEQLLSKQVIERFDPVLHPCLSGYRKNHSCETTLIKLTEDWKLTVDEKQYGGVLLKDTSKAFDSLYPPLMMNKLIRHMISLWSHLI